jgi:hypothetical protein
MQQIAGSPTNADAWTFDTFLTATMTAARVAIRSESALARRRHVETAGAIFRRLRRDDGRCQRRHQVRAIPVRENAGFNESGSAPSIRTLRTLIGRLRKWSFVTYRRANRRTKPMSSITARADCQQDPGYRTAGRQTPEEGKPAEFSQCLQRQDAPRPRDANRRAGRAQLRPLRRAMENTIATGWGARAPQSGKARMRRLAALPAVTPRFATRLPAHHKKYHAEYKNACPSHPWS